MVIMKKLIALVFVPGIGVAGTSYDLNFRDLARPASAPMTSRHFVQDSRAAAVSIKLNFASVTALSCGTAVRATNSSVVTQ
jgi:hypothetical protein